MKDPNPLIQIKNTMSGYTQTIKFFQLTNQFQIGGENSSESIFYTDLSIGLYSRRKWFTRSELHQDKVNLTSENLLFHEHNINNINGNRHTSKIQTKGNQDH